MEPNSPAVRTIHQSATIIEHLEKPKKYISCTLPIYVLSLYVLSLAKIVWFLWNDQSFMRYLLRKKSRLLSWKSNFHILQWIWKALDRVEGREVACFPHDFPNRRISSTGRQPAQLTQPETASGNNHSLTSRDEEVQRGEVGIAKRGSQYRYVCILI